MCKEIEADVTDPEREIKDVGGKMEDIPIPADKAMEDSCKPGNPREDFIRLYEEVM